jgi:hypothetical protein
MNANELADELERPMLTRPDCLHFGRTKKFMEQIITMLRQQQAEIEELKQRPEINKEDGLVCAKCYERIGE